MRAVLIILIFLIPITSYSQNSGRSILGKWLKIPKEDLIIEVYNSDNSYKAKITWATDSTRKPPGFIILNNLEFNAANNSWENGKISDPVSGRTYDADVILKDDGTLEVLAYKGFRMFGTKKYFTRIK